MARYLCDASHRLAFKTLHTRGFQKLFCGHAEAEIIAVGIGHGKFTESPGLVDWCGVNWGIGTLGRVETALAKGGVALVDIVDEHAIHGAEDAVPGMAGQLEFGAIEHQIDDSVFHFAIFVSRPLALEVENFGVEVQGSLQVA